MHVCLNVLYLDAVVSCVYQSKINKNLCDYFQRSRDHLCTRKHTFNLFKLEYVGYSLNNFYFIFKKVISMKYPQRFELFSVF